MAQGPEATLLQNYAPLVGAGQGGTQGAHASVFQDAAAVYKQDRLKQEEEADERRAGRMKTLEAAGNTVMRQAEMAADQRALQSAKWKDAGVIGDDSPFKINQPQRGNFDFKNKMSDIFSSDQQLGLTDKAAEGLKGGSYQDYTNFVGTDKFKASGMDATQLGKDLGWGDAMGGDQEHIKAMMDQGYGSAVDASRGEVAKSFGAGYTGLAGEEEVASQGAHAAGNLTQKATPAANKLVKNVSAGVKDLMKPKGTMHKSAGQFDIPGMDTAKDALGGLKDQFSGLFSKGGTDVAAKATTDVAAKGGAKAAEQVGAKGAEAAGKSMLGKAAGGVTGVIGAGKGAMKMADSKTAEGKVGGALEMAGGLAGAGAALGLLSGPVGWAGLGASVLGGFLSD